MSETNITVSKSFFQELGYKIQKISDISDDLDVLAFESRQVSLFLKSVYKNARIKEID